MTARLIAGLLVSTEFGWGVLNPVPLSNPLGERFGIAPASAAAAACPVRGGTLRAGMYSDFVNLDPDVSTTLPDREAWKEIFNTLVGITADLKLVPELAESWEFPSPTRLVFHLRHGVKFQDGTDFNAQAVKFNIDRKKSAGGPRVSELSLVESVDVIDPYTVRFNLREPFSPLLAILTDGSGMMSSPAAVQKYGRDYSQHPVGAGPFSFVEWLKDDHLTVRRFPDYWDPSLPCLDEIRFVPVPDTAVKLTDLEAGALDLIDSVAPKDVATIKRDRSYRYSEVSDLGWRSLDFNVTQPPFTNKAVRQAIAWAVDRNVLHKAILFNTGVIAQGPISPALPAYDPAFAPYHQDLKKAKALLAEGGESSGFRFTLLAPRVEVRDQVAQVLKEELAPLGVEADIQMVDFGQYIRTLTTRGYSVELGGWSGRPDLDGSLNYLFSTTGSQNYTGYSNPQVDVMLERARLIADPALRTRLYRQAQAIVADDAPVVFLFYLPQNVATTLRVHGAVASPDDLVRLKTVWMDR